MSDHQEELSPRFEFRSGEYTDALKETVNSFYDIIVEEKQEITPKSPSGFINVFEDIALGPRSRAVIDAIKLAVEQESGNADKEEAKKMKGLIDIKKKEDPKYSTYSKTAEVLLDGAKKEGVGAAVVLKKLQDRLESYVHQLVS